MAEDEGSGDPPRAVAEATPRPPAEVPQAEMSMEFGEAESERRELVFGVGERIGGRYCVRAVLGEGGMGRVYRALDEHLDEEVALKVVRGDRHSAVDALRDEVKISQHVTHPNVCRTYDLEEVEGTLFVKMEYVNGESLAARLAKTKPDIDESVRIARGIADGLAAVHGQGIIHRDLKPANVMIGEDGRVVLMDFGLAHHLAAGSAGIGGTPGYMAPEQILGEDIDKRTDYYALGCVVYEMLAGERVFGRGSQLEIADRHVEAMPRDLRDLDPHIPRRIARAAHALLAKRPAARELGIQLLAPQLHRSLIPSIVIAVLALAVVIVWFARSPAPEWRPEIVDLGPAVEESSDGASLSPDGTRIAFNSDRAEVGKFRVYVMNADGSDVTAITPPDALSFDEPRWTRDGSALLTAKGWSAMLRIPVTGGAPQLLGEGSSPDDCGDAIAFVVPSWDGSRLMLQHRDGTRRELVRVWADEFLEKPRCDPSGQRIVFARGTAPISAFGSDIYMVDRAGTITSLTTDHRSGAATFTHDGRGVIYASRRDGKPQLYEMPVTGGASRQLTFGDAASTVPDAARTGDSLLFGREVNLFAVWTGGGGEPRRVTSLRASLYSLRPIDGATLVAERAEGEGNTVVSIGVADGEVRALVPGYLPFPSRDGARVYFRAVDDPSHLKVIARGGGVAESVARLPGRILLGHDAPDGRHLSVDNGHRIESWRVDRDGKVLPDGVAGLLVPAPSGPWRYVQTTTRDGDFKLVVDGGGERRELTATSMINTWLDDRRLAFASGKAIVVVDVTTGAAVDTLDATGHVTTNTVVTPNGKQWFDSTSVSRVTRHRIVKFDAR